MAECYNQHKISLRLVKSALTKAISKLEATCKELSKAPKELPMVTKVRLIASVVEALGIVTEKSNKVSEVCEKNMSLVVDFDPTEFAKVSNKSKEVILEES